LDNKLGVLDVTTTATEVFILDVCVTDVALVLDLDELGFYYEAKYL
jgi:hypothetical protein